MFLRRRKITGFRRLREAFWPSAGWRRTGSYLFHRVARLPGTPYFLAAGFACGVAVSFTPMVGAHLALACLLAWALRASLLAAAVGTAVGNPWTFPFIWFWTYKSGRWLLDIRGGIHPEHVDFSAFFGNIIEATLRVDARFLFEVAWPVLAPMIVGGIPSALVAGFGSYFVLRPVVAAYQVRRQARRTRNVLERGKTGENEQALENANDAAPSTGR